MLAYSYTWRLVNALGQAFQRAWSSSLLGRSVAVLLGFLARLARGSVFLSLDSGRSRLLEEGSASRTGLQVSRAYRWLRAFAAESPPGRWSRAGLAAVPLSVFAGQATRPLGAAFLGLGAARLIRLPEQPGTATESVLMAVFWTCAFLGGALLLAWGPALAPSWCVALSRRTGSLLWRAFSGRDDPSAQRAIGVSSRRFHEERGADPLGRGANRWVLWMVVAAASVLAGATAFVAGLSSPDADLVVVGTSGVLFLAGLVVYRVHALLVLLAAFPWLDWAARRSLGGFGAAWDELLLLGSLALLGYAALFTRQVRLRTVPITLPLVVALVAALASQAVRDVPTDVSLFALRITFQPLLFYYLGYLLPRDRRWVRLAVSVFLAASLLLALHGIYQYLTNAPMPTAWLDQHEMTIGTRAYSIILNPNGLGAFLLLGALLSVSLALAPLDRIHRLGMALLAVVLLVGIGVTFSRGAWIALVLGGFALAALAYRRLFGGLVAVALAAPFIVPKPFLDRITFAFSQQYIAASLRAGRLLMWDVSLRRVVAQPLFGSGLGTFGGTSAVTFGFHKLWVDNFYIQMAAEGGLILFAAFMWLLLRTVKGLVAATLDHTDAYLRAVSAGVFAGFLAVAMANFTASVWETLAVGAGSWFLAGLASRPVDEPAEEEERPPWA